MHERLHGSSGPVGSGLPPADRRITDLILESMMAAPSGRPARNAADPFRVASAVTQSLDRVSPLVFGTVVHAVPHLNWYKVQTLESGFLGCCLLRHTSAVPVGVHSGSVVPPNSCVLVFKSPHLDYGIILGVLPPLVQSNAAVRPDSLTQGGGSGLRTEAAHQQPLRSTLRAGGVRDFSCGSPLDATSMEWSLIAETGVALLVDPFQAYLRVNEHCGLFLNLFDSYARLIGQTLDVFSSVHEESFKNDEGENYAFRGFSTYPWEASGNFTPGGGADFEEFDALAVQSGSTSARYDSNSARPDTRPFHRYREYHAYLGQGGLRSLCAPPASAGFNSADDAGASVSPGLFAESIGLDGSYLLRSAKSITLVKRCNVPVPRTVRDPENPLGDGADGNYRFSGQYGSGPAHRIGDLQVGDLGGSQRVLDLYSYLAHACNWKALHPFHYHAGDFDVPQEADASGGAATTVAEVPDFAELVSSNRLSEPVPFRLRIDHRYGQVNFYRRESVFAMHDDGSVVLDCGNGARIAMVNGKLRIEAPGDIEIVSGRRVVALGRDVILSAAASVDVTAHGGDIHLAADFNLQAVGNAVLIESRNETRVYDYANRVGEEVVASGIVLRSASDLAFLGEDIYLRSGASGETGDIVFDAAARSGRVMAEASSVEIVTEEGVTFAHGSTEQSVQQAHVFSGTQTILPSTTYVSGDLRIGAGALTVDGSIATTGDVAASGRVADGQGGMIGRLPESARQRLREALQVDRVVVERARQAGNDVVTGLARDWRSGNAPGSPALLRDMHFSFRDDKDGRQYGSGDVLFIEPRWQQMARQAGLSVGSYWPDGGVPYQGQMLYPWPGRAAWHERGSFLRAGTPTLYDPATGTAVERGDAYADAALAEPTVVTMNDGLRVIL